MIYYHYTTITGCLGILKSRSIWFTDHQFVNDNHEIKKGLTKLLAHFEEGEKKSFLDAFCIHNFKTRYCIFSLSKDPFSLSQWRAYAEDGTGVAIGLNRQFLEVNIGAKLVACEYKNHEEITKAIKDKHEAFI